MEKKKWSEIRWPKHINLPFWGNLHLVSDEWVSEMVEKVIHKDATQFKKTCLGEERQPKKLIRFSKLFYPTRFRINFLFGFVVEDGTRANQPPRVHKNCMRTIGSPNIKMISFIMINIKDRSNWYTNVCILIEYINLNICLLKIVGMIN